MTGISPVRLLLLALTIQCTCHASAGVHDVASPTGRADIVPAVFGKVMPVFFQKASKVVIQLVRDKLSSVSLGDLETYADGEVHGTRTHPLTDSTAPLGYQNDALISSSTSAT